MMVALQYLVGYSLFHLDIHYVLLDNRTYSDIEDNVSS